MAEDCVFCKIIEGKIPSKKIYEDESAIAFLDINPASKGHSLIITKKHHGTLLDTPETELRELMIAIQKVGAAVMKATKADGFNVVQNNGEAAGQVIHHIHFHVVPRFKGDSLKLEFGSRKMEEEELAHWHEQIKDEF